MNEQHIKICDIPSVIYGEPSEKVCLFVHGKCGCKEEAQELAKLVCDKGYQVLGFDLPEHGERRQSVAKLVPWEVVPEFESIILYIKKRWKSVFLYANSIGAYISLLAFQDEAFEKCILVSPILDMTALIEKMLGWAGVTAEKLRLQKEIPTSFGETLSWDYYTFAKNHSVVCNSPTSILYAGHDNLTDRTTVTDFAERFGCQLTIFEEGEHWFHTPEQLDVLRKFVAERL